MKRREQRSVLRACVAMVGLALLSAACADSAGTGVASDAQRATSTIVEIGPSSSTTAAEPSDPSATATADPSTTATADPPTTLWPELAFTLAPVVDMSQPTAIGIRPGSDDLWLAERAGRVRRVARIAGTDLESDAFDLITDPVIDITDRVTTNGEGGLLGLAFPADGSSLYLHYTRTGGDSVIAEYPMTGDQAEADGQRVVLTVEQPFANHNGGDLTFGPDGLLYISLGDGGAAGDPFRNGQDRTTLLGSILRIDPRPEQGAAYRVPADNPFVDSAGEFRPEIWIWGVRNPWRFSFDARTGDLWIADVGQDAVEEINLLPAGGDEPAGRGANLGWNLVEGDEPFAGEAPDDHSPPLYTYEHRPERCSVTGGYVYRGAAIPELDGVYLFSDLCGRQITGLARSDDGSITVADLVLDREVDNVIGFGLGPVGELYVLEQPGRVSRLQTS